MNNLLSYCRLVDARISASEKDLPVIMSSFYSSKPLIKESNSVLPEREIQEMF